MPALDEAGLAVVVSLEVGLAGTVFVGCAGRHSVVDGRAQHACVIDGNGTNRTG